MKVTHYLAIVVILLLSACAHTKELEYQNIQNFSMKQGAKPSVTLDIRLYNPNHFDLKLKNADVDVFLNGTALGKLRVEGVHLAPKLDTFLLPVIVDVNQQTVLPSIIQVIMSGDVNVKLTGKMKGGRHGVYINVPVDYEAKQNLLNYMK